MKTTEAVEQLEFKGISLTRFKCSCGASFYAKTDDAEVKSCGHERAKRDAGSFVVAPISDDKEPHERTVEEEAYQLWEQAGRPEGRSDEFWHKARKRIEAEEWTEAYDGLDLNYEIDEVPSLED